MKSYYIDGGVLTIAVLIIAALSVVGIIFWMIKTKNKK